MIVHARAVVTAALGFISVPLFAACQGDPRALPGPYGAEVARAIPQIESATGLKFKTPPTLELRTRDELREFLKSKFDEDQPALELAGQERAYKLFGLLPDTLQLRSFLLALLEEQVVGYYDPATKVLYVVSGGPGGPEPAPEVLNVTITHELIHALQDQYLPLDSLMKARSDNDHMMAIQALVEGQAIFEQLSVMLGGGNMFTRMPGGWDRVRQMIRDSQGAMPVLGSAPMFIQETLLFPYLSGAEFMRQVKDRNKGEVLAWVPMSTEQVLHPERLLDSLDVPLRVTLPRPAGGTLVYENGLGEFETRLMLHQQVKNVETASRAATGWGGDRYMLVNTPNGAGITWVSVWDTPVEAAEFRFVLLEAIEKRFYLKARTDVAGPVMRYSARGRSIEVGVATVQGHPAVIYTDVPAGASARLIDVTRVTVTPVR